MAAVVVGVVTGSPLLAAAVYNYFSVTGANLERGRGFFESSGRGILAGGATLAGGTIGGGAASAALVGGDPGKGALLGVVQGAAAVVGAAIPAPTNPFMQVAQSAALGAAQGATGAAIVGGDPGRGAWMGAASAAAVTSAFIVAGQLQTAMDAGRASGASEGRISVPQAINKIAKTEFGQSQQGHSVLRALRVAYHEGKIGFDDLSAYGARAVSFRSRMSILVDPKYSGSHLPGRLAHEGTHLVQFMHGQTDVFSMEREAFNNAYAVDAQLGVSDADLPSDAEIRRRYGL